MSKDCTFCESENESEKKVCFFYRCTSPKRGFLSQWSFTTFEEDGIEFNCAEQYMMYKKALLFKDEDSAKAILEARLPWKQRHIGRKILFFDNKVWTKHRYHIAKQGNRLKFEQNPNLKRRLCEIEGEIVEASPDDSIWGIGMDISDENLLDRSRWGENLLGQILMELRHEFQMKELEDKNRNI